MIPVSLCQKDDSFHLKGDFQFIINFGSKNGIQRFFC